MIEILKITILGIIQGLTEFLPVSSSGHLVFFQNILDINNQGVLTEIVLHLGTLLAILIYFRQDIIKIISGIIHKEKEEINLAGFIILATIPAVFIGLSFEDKIEGLFTIETISVTFFITTLFLFATKFLKENKMMRMVWWIALLIGFAQAFAILPGISRSGATIAMAMFIGIQRNEAARFSFLLAIPVLFGAGLLKIIDISSLPQSEIIPLLFGFTASAISGYLVIQWLLSLISNKKFWIFSIYTGIMSILSFIIGQYNG
jgi:undecaprenyl-diphosphatase